ncbi:MAG: maleylacetoacetate isomerase [Candidatus Andeanibacterium colombiense]|uniref:Maleylacetoacetate isomerase n=1 Tax=Candidatus Andeanibacterium colombiense TaxID=3121345 RepID=A0AAJ6BR97_9SPHN|nr:MAG: maleylacetoacetate isomerase [Sphingomonadaceae bacterium]
MSDLVLHGYWRSTASYRVRIALALKGVAYRHAVHDLRTGDQGKADYLSLNPQGLVPTLATVNGVIPQSLAILEWIEEAYPEPQLLPTDGFDRAIVRAMANLVCCDIHPLNNVRVLEVLKQGFHANEQAVRDWIARWITAGFAALEHHVAQAGGDFAFGDRPSMADCCLIPQVYSATRFGVDLAPFSAIRRVAATCESMPQFQAAHPGVQPAAD